MPSDNEEIVALKEAMSEHAERIKNLVAALDEERSERARATPIGAVLPFAGDTVPDRYKLCDGQPLKSSDFLALFAAIGTLHGAGVDGNGKQVPGCDFNLPDYRGYFLRGADATGRVDPDAAHRSPMRQGGRTSGVGSVQGWATREPHSPFSVGGGQHNHRMRGFDLPRNLPPGDKQFPASGNWEVTPVLYHTETDGNHTHNVSGGDPETRPTNAAVNYIIKVN